MVAMTNAINNSIIDIAAGRSHQLGNIGDYRMKVYTRRQKIKMADSQSRCEEDLGLEQLNYFDYQGFW